MSTHLSSAQLKTFHPQLAVRLFQMFARGKKRVFQRDHLEYHAHRAVPISCLPDVNRLQASMSIKYFVQDEAQHKEEHHRCYRIIVFGNIPIYSDHSVALLGI